MVLGVAQILLAQLDEPFRTMVILDLATGLRCSELFALKWCDVLWDDLTLLRQIVHGPFASVHCMDENALFAQGLGSGARLTRTVHIHKIFLTNPAEACGVMAGELSTGGTRSLRNFLGELVWRHFFEDVRLEEPQVATYVAAVLADFVRTESLHRILNVQGKPLEDVGEMLVESNPLLEAASFDREREVRKHVGDYTLFRTGLFPENVARI
jgi:hypothetical protein